MKKSPVRMKCVPNIRRMIILFLMNGCQVGGWTCQPLESPNPEESTKKPVIIVVIAAGGAGEPI